MEASIEEDPGLGEWVDGVPDRVAVHVTDAEGNDHTVVVGEDDGIVRHATDAYPRDPAERTGTQRARVDQARRYARYRVSRDRGWDVLPWSERHDRIDRVRRVVEALSPSAFEDRFGALYRQVTSHDFPERTRSVEIPPGVDHEGGDFLMYMQDVYLDEDAGSIAATSGIHRLFYEDGQQRVLWGSHPLDRPPDARVQKVPTYAETLRMFKRSVEYHLRCQVRDCFVGRGIDPPEEYRVLGPGINELTRWYQQVDAYEEYHRYSADVPGYADELGPPGPLEGVAGKLWSLFGR